MFVIALYINNVVCKQVITIIIGEYIFVQLGFSSKVPCRVTSGRLYFDSLVAQTFCTEFRMADKGPAALKWSWHIFSQITTDLFCIIKAIITQ